MGKEQFFETSEGKLILKQLKKDLDILHQIKEKIFSTDHQQAQKAREEFKSFFEKAQGLVEKMDNQTFAFFMKMKNYFNNASNFSGEGLALKESLIDSYKDLFNLTIPASPKMKKSSFSSKLKGQKKWKRS